MNKKNPVSIIVPIYKVERYIESCLHSLFMQTYPHIEYIFVDDKGEDNSIKILMEVMKKYPHRMEDIHIIHHTQNRGLAAARNTGITASTGEYILQIDSDDYVCVDMVEKMYSKALAENADMVICDYYLQFQDKKIYRPEVNNAVDDKIRHILLRQFQHNSPMVWNKLIRRSLYIDFDIHCIEGCDLGEDTLVVPQLLNHSSKVVHIHEAFVYYVQYNTNSITRNVYAYDGFLVNLEALENRFKQEGIFPKFELFFEERKWLVTASILCSRFPMDKKKQWMTDIIHKQPLKVDFWNIHIPLFQKIILWLFAHKIYFIPQALLYLFPKARKGRI